MNAQQRRLVRRQVLAVLPLDCSVVTPTGSVGTVVAVKHINDVVVRLRNNTKKAFRPAQLERFV